MKKVRLFSLAAIVALSSFIAPQTASAYKYHVTLPDGTHEVFGVSGFFRLVTPYVRNKVVPLPYGTDQATTRHSSGCAYRQLRCCKF